MTRSEHMKWCKQRAHAEYNYYKAKDPDAAIRSAVASMLSDLGKHPETAGLQQMAAVLMLTVRTEADLDRFIDGFAE
jgi:hypothetical protein